MLYLENLVSKNLKSGCPWDFVPTETISDDIRHKLTVRQAFYQNPNTRHSFYTFTEGASNVRRVTQDKGENPPRLLRGVVADYDLKLTDDEITAGIAAMGDRKPTRWETSLGGKFRLVWEFAAPLRVLNASFAVSALKHLREWLPLDKLPGLDEPAFIDPAKHYANGCIWRKLDNAPIAEDTINGLFVKVARDFAFRGAEAGPEIPYPVVFTALKEKFPTLQWPTEFVLNSQGPSFWVSGSTSTMSAIVKDTGMMTFAGHADRSFYSWRDLLGQDFVEKYELQTLSDATKDTFYDGKQYWRKLPSGLYEGETFEEVRQFLKIDCGVPAKTVGGEPSQLDRCLQHIRNYNRVAGAAPYVFRTPGLLALPGGAPFLNTWRSNVIQPVAGKVTWTDAPFLSAWLPRLFVTPEQLEWVLSWMAYAYRGILDKSPVPGHALFVSGGVGIGKSLWSRYGVGGLFGGFQDAASYLMGDDNFNSELFEVGLWCLDDETPTGDERMRRRFANMVKKVAANSEFRSNKKFCAATKVEWIGRLVVTLNFDQTSNRTLMDPEASVMDKVGLLRAADSFTDFAFPRRAEILRLLATELPVLGKMLADWEIPAHIVGDSRYGIKPMHDKTMVDQASQSSPASAFYELVSDWRKMFFEAEGAKKECWEGTTTQLIRSMKADPTLGELMGKYTPESIGRLLSSLRAMKVLRMDAQTTGAGIRTWKIYRDDSSSVIAPAPVAPALSEPFAVKPKNPFEKS